MALQLHHQAVKPWVPLSGHPSDSLLDKQVLHAIGGNAIKSWAELIPQNAMQSYFATTLSTHSFITYY